MSKFKVGDKVIPVKIDGVIHKWLRECTLYLVKNIQEGDLIDIVVLSDDQPTLADGRGDGWSEDWFELYEENGKEMSAESIREDILHIEKRIEEAKKDIASMEQEKTVLIEKLKEKGFEMIGQKPSSTTLEVGDRVVITGYSKGYHEYDYTGYEGTLELVDDTARPYEVFLDRTGMTHWFTKNECKKI